MEWDVISLMDAVLSSWRLMFYQIRTEALAGELSLSYLAKQPDIR